MRIRSIGRALLAVALMTAGGTAAEAQQGPRRPGGRMEMERRVQARFAEMVRVQLGLTQEQQERFAEVLREFQDRRETLVLRERQLRRRIRGVPLAREEAVELLPEEDARDVLREMIAIREDEARLLREEQGRLLEVVSAPQLARFYAMRDQLAERIRRLQEGPGGGMGPGRDWSPGPR